MKAVSYIRVSTRRQGKSGLGIEAQRARIADFINSQGGELLAEYVDVNSGAKNDRDALQLAIAHAKRENATLVIAKLDRISRNVSFIAHLMERGIDFKIAEMGNATAFQIHVYAALAEEERRMIRERTKAALTAAKRRGVKLGRYGKVLAKQNKQAADAFAQEIQDRLISLRSKGLSFGAIAKELNQQGVMSFTGGRWYGTTVQRAYERVR